MFTLISAQLINIIKMGATADISIIAANDRQIPLDITNLESYIGDHVDIIESHTWIPYAFDGMLFHKFRLATLAGWRSMGIKAYAIQENFCEVAYLRSSHLKTA